MNRELLNYFAWPERAKILQDLKDNLVDHENYSVWEADREARAQFAREEHHNPDGVWATDNKLISLEEYFERLVYSAFDSGLTAQELQMQDTHFLEYVEFELHLLHYGSGRRTSWMPFL